MTEKLKNQESFTENEKLKEQLKQISYNLEHTKPEYLRKQFNDIEWNKEAYEILIKWIKDLIINDWKLNKNNFSTIIFIQIIWKIKWKFEWKRDWKWSPEIDKLIPQIFSSNELNNIKIIEPNILNNKKESKEKIKVKETPLNQELQKIQSINIPKNPLENTDFQEFSKYTKKEKINWVEITIFNSEIIKCLNRYELNKKPLLELLWNQEKVNKFLELIKSDTWEEILNDTFVFENYKDIWKKLQIVSFENNQEWQELTAEILINTYKLKNDINLIQEQINDELKDVTNKTNKKEKSNLNQKELVVNDTMSCHISFDELCQKRINEKYEPLIKWTLKNYSRNIFEKIIDNPTTQSLIKNKQKINLLVWDNNIILDFSKLSYELINKLSNQNNSNKQISKELQNEILNNFDKVYIDNLTERFIHSIQDWIKNMKEHPEKTAVDFSSIVVSWVVTFWVVWWTTVWTWTMWTIPSLALSWATFTTVDNIYRWIWYWIIWESWIDEIDWKKSFSDWFKEWLWMNENWVNKEFLTKKWFELLSNTVLFWMFRLWSKIEQTITKTLEKWWEKWSIKALEILDKALKNKFSKLWIETSFFTIYTTMSVSIEESILEIQKTKNINRAEAMNIIKENFKNTYFSENMMKYFAYNLAFIGLVKGWYKLWWWNFAQDKIKDKLLNLETRKAIEKNNLLSEEIYRLNQKWIFLKIKPNQECAFYDKKWKKLRFNNKQFARFRELNKDFTLQIFDTQKIVTNGWKDLKEDPNNWKWTWAKTLKPILDVKYEKLERLSRKTETEWLNFALWKENKISESIETKWLNEWTKEWLIKEAWFTDNEAKSLKDYKPEKWSKEIKDKAVERMNSAVEVIEREFNKIAENYLDAKLSWKSIENTYLMKYNEKIRRKILLLFMYKK